MQNMIKIMLQKWETILFQGMGEKVMTYVTLEMNGLGKTKVIVIKHSVLVFSHGPTG